MFEKLKLKLRASKYKSKNDIGGIAYVNQVVNPGDTVFDIGAHKGGYLYFFQQRVGDSGRVVAFEPQTHLYRYLQKIITLMNWKNVAIEHLALSDSEGSADLFIPTNRVKKGSSPGASIVKEKDRSEGGITEKVATDTLDSYCVKHGLKPDFLKIDVEGNELNVFKGGEQTLKTHKPKIIVEIEARHVGEEKATETFDYLQKLGYKGFIVKNDNLVPLEHFSFEVHQNTEDLANYCNNFIFE